MQQLVGPDERPRDNVAATDVDDTVEPSQRCLAYHMPDRNASDLNTDKPANTDGTCKEPVIAHPTATRGARALGADSTDRTVSRTDAPLALAVLTTERKAA